VPQPHGGVELAWNLIVQTVDGDHWYDSSVSAVDGELIYLSDWIDDAAPDKYSVFAMPLENPNEGSRALVTDPANPTASPFGWHDTNGVAGADFTDTRGNNVFAQEDRNATDNGLGARPDGGAGLDFDFALDLGLEPIGYQDAAITNLFYWNNVLHDIHYQYGFDEASGNFQENNYGKGGVGSDPIQADAQYGAAAGQFNNAFFGTPPDGSQPQMRMLEFNAPNPNRDGDLSSVIIIHEYGHGVSNRLTGGPANANALNAIQSGGMGEGWGDWWALMLTQKPTDAQLGAYTIGTYVLNQPQNGSGIRRQPYSFDMTIDPLTYGNFNTSNEVHNAGEIWASTLWDLNWLLINGDGGGIPALGFDADLYNGTGGNNLALQLVMDGLKLQPANPSFLDGRDAILLADQVANGGANQLAIWTAFARRGMGYSADDGGSGNATTVVEAFDLPAASAGIVEFDATFYEAGDVVTIAVRDSDLAGGGPINLSVVSSGGDSETVTLTEIGLGVFESTINTSPWGTPGNGKLNMRAGDLITATYNDANDGTGNPAVVTDTADIVSFVDVFNQDFESGLGAGETLVGGFTVNNTNTPLNNGTLMMGHPATYGDNEYSYYEFTLDLSGITDVQMKFDYAAQIEDYWDGFNVLASTSPISPPNNLITPTSGLPYGAAFGLVKIGPTAYDGDSGLDSGVAVFDLTAFDGQVVNVRLQFGSDESVTNPGINIDNLRVRAAFRGGGNGTHTVVLATGEIATGIDFGNHRLATVTETDINGIGNNNRSGVATLVLQFDQPVTVNSVTSLQLYNHTTSSPINLSSATLQGNGTSTVTWDLSSVSLPDGRYTAELPARDATDVAGLPLASTHAFEFHVLRGDVSGDGAVNFADYGVVGSNFDPLPGAVYRAGDANGDGAVNFADYGVIGANFNPLGLAALTYDFGDAPQASTSYPTTLVNNSAVHIIGSGLFLGTGVDSENDGQPHADALGDDNAGDDEDGVTFGSLTAGSNANVTVVATVPSSAVLNAWIDFNADGDWSDPGEQIFTNKPLTNGSNALSFSIPVTTAVGNTFARFRVTTSAGYSFTGLAPNGEVEDYKISIGAPAAPSESSVAQFVPVVDSSYTEIEFAVFQVESVRRGQRSADALTERGVPLEYPRSRSPKSPNAQATSPLLSRTPASPLVDHGLIDAVLGDDLFLDDLIAG